MRGDITIVMYHYVRNLKKSSYPRIKGLDTKKFERQIDYIKDNYEVISGYDLIDIVSNRKSLPKNAALLTFDDGYADHFTNVFPVLDRSGLSGCFFPSAKPIVENKVLDVNKIQFIMASIPNESVLIKYIYSKIKERKKEFDLLSPDKYWSLLANSTNLDSAGVVFCKLMLQYELPFKLRTDIIHDLFDKYVTNDEFSFSKKLYMSREQIITMKQNGMYIGSHGYDHLWMDTLSPKNQEYEINKSLEFLDCIGMSTNNWIMCYPYGSYNESLISTINNNNCIAGLSTDKGVASLDNDNVYTLPRIDTVDI
jgi:peptidoglycan/xylan/chitin deacetylase (PgdA/CDA1 family)